MTYFFWDNFGVQFIPFELGKLKKLFVNGVILAHQTLVRNIGGKF